MESKISGGRREVFFRVPDGAVTLITECMGAFDQIKIDCEDGEFDLCLTEFNFRLLRS